MKTYAEQRAALGDFADGLHKAKLPYALYSSADLLKVFDPTGATRMNARNMGKAMTAAGYTLAAQGMPCLTRAGQVRLWRVKDIPEVRYVTQTEAARTYDEERGNVPV